MKPERGKPAGHGNSPTSDDELSNLYENEQYATKPRTMNLRLKPQPLDRGDRHWFPKTLPGDVG